MDGAPHNFQLLEPPSPEALVPDSRVESWMIVVAVAVFIMAALLVFWMAKKTRNAPLDPFAVRNLAYNEAIEALAAVGSNSPTREAAVCSSLILRKYLAAAAGDPALFETHEEYVSRHEALKNFTAEARTAAETGFTRLAALKYAADIPDVAAGNVTSESRTLLENLHQGFRP